MTLRLSIMVALLVGGLGAPGIAAGPESRREKRRLARKARRKAAEEKEREKPSITVSQKTTARLGLAALGQGGKIVTHKLDPPRLHEGLASRLRALQKVAEQIQ